MKQLTVEFSPEAQMDLLNLEDYLAERFYPETASRFVGRLIDACIALGRSPGIGVPQDDVRPGMRSISFERRATIYYNVLASRLLILTIDYRGRELVLPAEKQV